MPERHPHDEDTALKVAISASTSLAVMIVDFVWLMRNEVKHVWPGIRTSWTARIYVSTRYLGLASQIFNVCFTVRMYLGIYTSPAGCRAWFMFQAIVVQFLLASVEGFFMHRLYILFMRDRLILVILILFAVGQMASMWVSASLLSLPSNKYTVTCMLLKSNPGNAFFSMTTATTNMVVFFMTFWKYLRLPARFTRQGIGRVVMRDSTLSLGAISVIMLFLTLCSFQVIRPRMSGNITYYWLVCVLWISIGRIIVNNAKLPRDNGEQETGDTWRGTLQLTSQIEMGQSTLSDTQCGSSDGHTSSITLRSSLSIPVTKTDQLSPLGSPTSDSPSKWFGHHSPPQPSDTKPSVKVSMSDASRLSLPTSCTSNGDAPQTANHPQADADADGRARSPSPSPRLSSSEPPPPEASL